MKQEGLSGFSIQVAKENLKFSAAHFIAYPGFREPLHGHNYQVGVRVDGRLAGTGYVLDFGLVKKLTKEIAMFRQRGWFEGSSVPRGSWTPALIVAFARRSISRQTRYFVPAKAGRSYMIPR